MSALSAGGLLAKGVPLIFGEVHVIRQAYWHPERVEGHQYQDGVGQAISYKLFSSLEYFLRTFDTVDHLKYSYAI